MKLKKDTRSILKDTLLLFLPAVLIVGGVIAIFYSEEVEQEIELHRADERHHIDLHKKMIRGELKSILSDLKFLSKEDEILEILITDNAKFRKILSEEFRIFSEEKGIYDQIRLLDIGGKEVLRINFEDGESYIVEEDQLQVKLKRSYFKETFALGKEEIYMSSFDLNIEKGEIEQPPKPVIRFGMPLFDSQDRKLGIIILNYLGNILLEQFHRIHSNKQEKYMLLNAEGFFLDGPMEEDEWAFMYPEKNTRRFETSYPDAWPQISNADSGQFRNSIGLFTFTTSYPLLEAIERMQAVAAGSTPIKFDLLKARLNSWKIVSFVPEQLLISGSEAFLKTLLIFYLFFSVIMAFGSVLLAKAAVYKRISLNTLMESEADLAEAQRIAQVGSWRWDIGSDLLEMSDENRRIFQFAMGKVFKQKDFLNRLHPDDLPRVGEAIQQARQGDQPYDIEYRIVLPGGKERNIHSKGEFFYDKAGIPVSLRGTVSDITRRKQIEAEREKLIQDLESRNAEMEQFTYTASHELKSPLITIGGYLGLLKRDLDTGKPEKAESYIMRIVGGVKTMKQLLDEMLELSRGGRQINPPEEVSLNKLIDEAVEVVRGRLTEKEVEIKIAPALPMVTVDAVRVKEVFINLMENAVKFMGDQAKPLIKIGNRTEDGETTIYIKDNGIGIDPSYHEYVFGLFNRLDPQLDGTGIGLSLVKRIIEVHGGRIWIESEGLGYGSTFYMTFVEQNNKNIRKEKSDEGDSTPCLAR